MFFVKNVLWGLVALLPRIRKRLWRLLHPTTGNKKGGRESDKDYH